MEDLGFKPKHWIYFLLLRKGKYPPCYLKMARAFASMGITLVPVDYRSLANMLKSDKKAHVMVVERDLEDRNTLKIIMTRYLGFILKSHQVRLFHFSSFDSLLQKEVPRLRGSYFYFRMPQHLISSIRNICQEYFSFVQKRTRWPGGRRAKLPPLA